VGNCGVAGDELCGWWQQLKFLCSSWLEKVRYARASKEGRVKVLLRFYDHIHGSTMLGKRSLSSSAFEQVIKRIFDSSWDRMRKQETLNMMWDFGL
jgi:hypothetical protein